jgi:hypothetical protein
MTIVLDELVDLLKAPFVKEKVETFPRGKLTLSVLACASMRAATLFGSCVTAAKFLEFLVHGHWTEVKAMSL